MKKGLLCLSFMVGCFTIGGASCQSWQYGDMSRYETNIKSEYDSLETIQRPADIGRVPENEQKKYIITICGQTKFNQLTSVIISALEAGHKNIVVRIKKGTYFFREGHLTLENIKYPDADVRIEGKGVTIVPQGWQLKAGDDAPCDVSGESCFTDTKKKQSVSPWGEMMYADKLIEVIDVATKLCRLKCAALGNLKVPEGNMAYIDLTRWCRCYQYKVLKIENGYVEFYAHDLERDNVFGTKHYSVNYDYVVGNLNPRFRLCNVSSNESVSILDQKVCLNTSLKSVYLCDAANFLTLQKVELRQFILKGITFLGNKSADDALIKLKTAMTSNVEFRDCQFIGQMGEIITTDYSKNLYFHDNYVRDNYFWGIDVNSSSWNITIENNVFENNGTGLSFARCVSCSGNNYYIAHNKFKNFGYCAISVGAWYGTGIRVPAQGIVEYNEIWYDNKYFEEAWKHTIMDSGAIYVWTQNERCIIRYNYIHDYTGMGQNRGIYLDDGAHHVAVYGNVVVNTPMCHAIGSRRVARTEKARNKSSFSEKNNINNFIAYNITDGTVNFVGHEDRDNGCMEGMNILLRHSGKRLSTHKYKPELKSIQIKTDDIEMDYVKHDEIGLMVSSEYVKDIKQVPCYENMSKWINSNFNYNE